MVEKQTWAAFHGEHFAHNAARIYARTVVADVRRATVGDTSIENTHPFHHGKWIFAHNGTVLNFDRVRSVILEHMDPLHRTEVMGSTDSEHVFRYLMSLFLRHPERGLKDTVRTRLKQVITWSKEVDPNARLGLNIVLTDGEHLVGSRVNRSLHYLVSDHVFSYPICGRPHAHHIPKSGFNAVEIASEPVTVGEDWCEVPNNTLYGIADDYRLDMEPLRCG